MNNSVNLTIIPARSGSKGIPNKNTKLLGGRPLLTYSIEAWKESGIGGRLIVSTDSEEIACVAREYGADVPFLRPAHLAQDSTPMWEVVRHALIELEPDSFDGVILLQPTAPFRRPHEISQALEMYYRQKADTAVTVSSVSAHYNPHWLFSCDNNGRLTPCMSQRLTHTRRQDLPELFHRTGGVYVVRPSLVSQEQTLIGDNTYGIVVDGTRQVNIDSPRDWQQAEKLVQAREHVQICQTKSKVYLGAAQRIQHLGQGSVRDFADLAATVPDVVDLSVGQPDFDVPRQIKDAAIRAIQDGFNHYTATGGLAELRDRLAEHVTAKHPLWQHYDRDGTEGFDVFVTAGVTGGIINAFLSLVDPGSEVLICEPYFGLYKEAVVMSGGTPIFIDTFPDFRVTADRIQPLITDRSKLLVLNSPCNPTGSVIEPGELT